MAEAVGGGLADEHRGLMKKWKDPRPVVMNRRPIEPEHVILGTVLLVPGSLFGALIGALAGGIAAGDPGAGLGAVSGALMCAAAVLCAAVVSTVRTVRTNRGPRVEERWAKRFTHIDQRLSSLKERLAENPELVGSVGRQVLDARTRVLVSASELRELREGELVKGSDAQRVEEVLSAELRRIEEVITETLAALDEARELSGIGRTRLAAIESRFAGGELRDLVGELTVRREVMKDLREFS